MSDFALTAESYYSIEANKIYCSASQFKTFYGTEGCEARAMAEINGEYVRPTTSALLIGQYVDTALTEPEKMDQFLVDHPEMFSSRGATAGQLKSEFKHADEMIARVKQDKMMMKALSGDHQKIMTGTIFGLPFKVKMDVYIQGKAIVDLKTVESLHKTYYGANGRVSFVEYYNYIEQASIYQEIVYQNTGERLPFYLACVTKEPIPDIALVEIPNDIMHNAIYGNELTEGIARQCEQIRLLKSGEVEPIPCNHCAYCLPRKKIEKPILYTDLI